MRVVSTKTELHYWAESNPSVDTLGTVGAEVAPQDEGFVPYGHRSVGSAHLARAPSKVEAA